MSTKKRKPVAGPSRRERADPLIDEVRAIRADLWRKDFQNDWTKALKAFRKAEQTWSGGMASPARSRGRSKAG